MPCEGERESSVSTPSSGQHFFGGGTTARSDVQAASAAAGAATKGGDGKVVNTSANGSASTFSEEQRTVFFPESTFLHHKTRDKVRRAKKQHRGDLHWSEWDKFGYANSDFCEVSLQVKENLPRIYKKDTVHADFIRNFEVPGRPVLLCGWMDEWPAMKKWDLETLLHDYRLAKFKVGEKDNGDKIKLSMKYFMDYLKHQTDDSPLYLFESAVEDKANTCGLLNDWQVPDLFPVDLHAIVGDERRPPHRWFCVGPKRSGTTVHIDPLGTAAWNAVTSGYKRWALFPPNVSKQIVKGKHLMKSGEDDEPIMWFQNILPRIKEKYPDIPVYECIQGPGEVIYVPPNWWHAVLNLSDCVACTQNHFSFGFLEAGWRKFRKGRRRLAAHWFTRLKRYFPEKEVYGRLDLMNKVDGWEIRSGKFCRVRASSGFATDVSSDSSSSSSSSASSDDEDELSEIDEHVRRMRAGISREAWQAYFQTAKEQPSAAPRTLPQDTTPLARLTEPHRGYFTEKRTLLLSGCPASSVTTEPSSAEHQGNVSGADGKRQKTQS
ncbi:bifunctional arginine demethylase and lysyl-hydroxylase PSR [Cyclospora cayetanensis]|uniref:Bifunctional arginine demethylase and lysyl-hydroxylase PSR n=1 Tax=Cyclospora cayetanensis TaxID=88456 RepID=A0A6P5WCL5_9EIME|nr:bifunctional arginine demethylase and lysyl-hydroxylase PSR [Cyclospora cayetanensis]